MCNKCGRSLEIDISEDFTCGRCLVNAPSYDLARSLLKFDLHNKNIIHALKYNDKTILAKIFAELLFKRYKAEILDCV